MTTQTDSSDMKDFQVQANLDRPVEHKAVQTIKTEKVTPNIHMPNIPNSVNEATSKKRKLSSSRPAKTLTPSDSVVTDPSILNSEVYKIYRRNEDPKEAMKQIQNMKTCLLFEESVSPMPKKEVWKKGCEKVLEKIWSYGNTRKSKWEQIQAFLSGDINKYDLFDETLDGDNEKRCFSDILYRSFTEIKTLLPNGIEYWIVENFEGGVEVSKWYRGVSGDASGYYDHDAQLGEKIALLKMFGLDESTIEKYHYEFMKKKPVEITWLEFADTVARREPNNLAPYSPQHFYSIEYDVQESKTAETMAVDATLRILEHNYYDESKRTVKSYHGNSTRPLKKRRSKNEKEEMTNEAKKAALMECFKDRFGFTEFNDISIDELHRPLTA